MCFFAYFLFGSWVITLTFNFVFIIIRSRVIIVWFRFWLNYFPLPFSTFSFSVLFFNLKSYFLLSSCFLSIRHSLNSMTTFTSKLWPFEPNFISVFIYECALGKWIFFLRRRRILNYLLIIFLNFLFFILIITRKLTIRLIIAAIYFRFRTVFFLVSFILWRWLSRNSLWDNFFNATLMFFVWRNVNLWFVLWF